VDTKEALVQTAERIIADAGVEKFKLADLASAVGIHVSSIFSHFPEGRTGVISAIVSRTVAKMEGLFPSTAGDPEDLLANGVTELVLYLGDHPGQARLVLLGLEMPGGLPAVTQLVGEYPASLQEGGFSQMARRLSTILSNGEDAGLFRQVEVNDVYHLMLGMTLLKVVEPGYERSQAARRVLDAVLRYVRV